MVMCQTDHLPVMVSNPARDVYLVSGNNLEQVVDGPRASITKQYKMVPVEKRWCCVAGKVTTSLQIVMTACHWV